MINRRQSLTHSRWRLVIAHRCPTSSSFYYNNPNIIKSRNRNIYYFFPPFSNRSRKINSTRYALLSGQWTSLFPLWCPVKREANTYLAKSDTHGYHIYIYKTQSVNIFITYLSTVESASWNKKMERNISRDAYIKLPINWSISPFIWIILINQIFRVSPYPFATSIDRYPNTNTLTPRT